MAASANPPGNNQEGSSAAQKVTSSSPAVAATNGGVDNGGNKAAVDNSETISALRHNPGISVDWTHEEQSLLEDLLAKYSPFYRFFVLDVKVYCFFLIQCPDVSDFSCV